MNNPEQAKIQAVFDALFAGWKAERESNEEHWSLGQLTDALKALPRSSRVLIEYEGKLLGFGEADSYRGYYSDLCLEISGSNPTPIAYVIRTLEAADGHTFTGYKGGDYTMSRNTVLWVDYYGSCRGNAVCGLTKMDTMQAVGAPLYLITTQKKDY